MSLIKYIFWMERNEKYLMKIKLSKISKITALLVVFFMADKAIGLIRQVIIVRQFGLSQELDAFNVANNFPDLLFALISGGALAMAFIPVLTQTLTIEGQESAWRLFSRIANLAFVVTLGIAIIVALLSNQMVQWQVGIAPGFERQQQILVAELMRLNLIATIIFSISGLVMAGLQANNHFLLPAAAPLFYNIGQIFGAVILAPGVGYHVGPITLPSFGLGVYGLVYGVIIGAMLHLLIQVPGLIKYKYKWEPGIHFQDKAVQQVLTILGPRLVTMLCIQLVFIVRDNMASRLETGSISALTYGWMFFQLPETLIGTAIGTAMLPSLAALAAKEDWQEFSETIEKAIQTLLVLTIPVALVLSVGLGDIVSSAFHFNLQQTNLIMWVTRGYLLGLAGQSVLEVAVRSYYARKDPVTPLIAAAINLIVYTGFAFIFSQFLGAVGISLADSLAFTSEAVLLLFLFRRSINKPVSFLKTIPKGLLGGLTGALITAGCMLLLKDTAGPLLASIISLGVGGLAMLPIIWKELRQLTRL
jgi:putative peptidoglycan lipid II flippase